MELKIIIKDMIQMQKALDSALYKGNNATYSRENTYLALFDELGELNHELKKEWCWWKKTQAPVNRERVLEELVDCWHFALNIFYHEFPHPKLGESDWNQLSRFHIVKGQKIELNLLYSLILDELEIYSILVNMVALSQKLGFTMKEVYNAYIEKNRVNYDRLANNY